MSYQEKKIFVTVASGVILLIAYCTTILTQYRIDSNANDLKFWAVSILSFIGISVAIQIVIQVVFHVLMSASIAIKNGTENEKEIEKEMKLEMVEDERDHLIELKSLRVGYIITGIGFIMAIITSALGYSAAIMINIMFLGGMIGSIIEGIAQLYYYRNA